jgi:sugar transferase (PEP-CTERM/EpsH1 system associated)
MANLLYLVHRLPYPPNKGDKVRSYHLLKHLAARHRIFLGTFIDDPEDEIHIETVRMMCAALHVERLNPAIARMRSLSGFLTRQALSLAYYRDTGMSAWVARTRTNCKIDATVVFSSAMAQYAPYDAHAGGAGSTTLVDFVDVDSAKWTQYASQRPWPLSWVYAREGKRLLDYERALALSARRSFFVTENETSLFLRRAPECEGKVEALGNGVDADFFSPDVLRPAPFANGSVPIVFTGAMDYWPNVDAVTWFVADVLPLLLQLSPKIRFYIVGRSPSPGVQALASDVVVVTGTVADVRPYLQHAAVVVAPMRIARGVQNKILEAMAMARPVVAAQDCVDAINANPGADLVSASTADDYVQAIRKLLQRPEYALEIGVAGRRCVVQKFSWDAHLSRIDPYLPQADSGRTVPMSANIHEPA